MNGGTLQTMGFFNGSGNNTNTFINFNGGAIKAGNTDNANFIHDLGGVYSYGSGGTFDNNGRSITIPQAILAPSGSGVSTISLSSGGSGYSTPPQVIINGDGSGATGYATISNGVVTGIVVTNPGNNYNSASVTLVSDTSATPAVVNTASLTTNVAGGMTFVGAGTTSLTGNNTYGGATTVRAGTLQLTGSGAINGSSTITINGSGAKLLQNSSTAITSPIVVTRGTLDGTTSVANVSVGSLGVITHGNGSTGSLSASNLSLVAGATAALNIPGGTSTTSFGIGVSNALSTDSNGLGSITLNINAPLGSLSQPLYELIQYGSFVGSVSDFKLGTVSGLSARQQGVIVNDTTDNAIALQVTGLAANLLWQGASSGTWATGSTNNWFNTGTSATDNFFTGDSVTLDDSATGTTTINVSASGVAPGGVTFNNSSKTYTFNGGSITGSGSLAVNGGGVVVFNQTNTYTGGTSINSGTLQVGSGGVTALWPAALRSTTTPRWFSIAATR